MLHANVLVAIIACLYSRYFSINCLCCDKLVLAQHFYWHSRFERTYYIYTFKSRCLIFLFLCLLKKFHKSRFSLFNSILGFLVIDVIFSLSVCEINSHSFVCSRVNSLIYHLNQLMSGP